MIDFGIWKYSGSGGFYSRVIRARMTTRPSGAVFNQSQWLQFARVFFKNLLQNLRHACCDFNKIWSFERNRNLSISILLSEVSLKLTSENSVASLFDYRSWFDGHASEFYDKIYHTIRKEEVKPNNFYANWAETRKDRKENTIVPSQINNYPSHKIPAHNWTISYWELVFYRNYKMFINWIRIATALYFLYPTKVYIFRQIEIIDKVHTEFIII